MSSPRMIPLVRYRYDSLDRLVDCALLDQPVQQRFYQKNRLASETQGQLQHSYFQQQDLLLAQQRHLSEACDATLLGTDLQRSVLQLVRKEQQDAIRYTPYGSRATESGLMSLLGFNGERVDPVTGHYLLGNGYRVYNPVLMRFHSPDSWSPFGAGQYNAYAYCGGEPVGRTDPSGHIFKVLSALFALTTVGLSVGAVLTEGQTRMLFMFGATATGGLSVASLFGAYRRPPDMFVESRNRGAFAGAAPRRGPRGPVVETDPAPSYLSIYRNSTSTPPPSYEWAAAQERRLAIESTVFPSSPRGSAVLNSGPEHLAYLRRYLPNPSRYLSTPSRYLPNPSRYLPDPTRYVRNSPRYLRNPRSR